MANPLLYVIVFFAVILFALIITQVVVLAKGKNNKGKNGKGKQSSKGQTNRNIESQIIPTLDTERRLTNALNTPDESIQYSFELNSSNNDVVHTVMYSGRGFDVNTFWRFIQDPNGREIYRLQSVLTDKYVTFSQRTENNGNGIRYFTYLTVDDDILGTPGDGGNGWFVFLRSSFAKELRGYRYQILSYELKGFYLATAITWSGVNNVPYQHFWYDSEPFPETPDIFRRPIHPYSVYLVEDGKEEFYIDRKFPNSSDVISEVLDLSSQ